MVKVDGPWAGWPAEDGKLASSDSPVGRLSRWTHLWMPFTVSAWWEFAPVFALLWALYGPPVRNELAVRGQMLRAASCPLNLVHKSQASFFYEYVVFDFWRCHCFFA